MVAPERWAAAFINAIYGGAVNDSHALEDAEEGFAALRVFAACTGRIPRAVSGSVSAAQLNRRIRAAMEKTGIRGRGPEIACRFIVLLVKKNALRYNGTVIQNIEKLLDQKRGVCTVFAETAQPPEGDFEEKLKEALRQKLAIREVTLITRIDPELLSGYRLRIGSEILDASLRLQIQKMAEDLSVPPGTAAAGMSHGGFSW
jgi:F-type H+-transporting ATPase subunit delta